MTGSTSTTVSRRGNTVTVTVAGELELNAITDLVEQFRAVISSQPSRIIVDLADLAYCDSSGLGVFVWAKRAADAASVPMSISRVQPDVYRLFTFTGVADMLNATPANPVK